MVKNVKTITNSEEPAKQASLELDRIESRVAYQYERMSTLNERLLMVSERIFGEEAITLNATNGQVDAGMIGNIHKFLNFTNEMLDKYEILVERFEKL